MSYLKRISDGAVTDPLDHDSTEYQSLVTLRDPTNTAKVLWEEVADEDVAAATSFVIVLSNPGAALAADETTSGKVPQYSGTITAASVVPNADIVGADTNSRTITVQQVTMAGTSSPTRAVTVLATLAMVAAAGTASKGQPKAMTINNAAFVNREPLQVVSTHVGTGIVDPGGLVVVTYTRV